MVIDEFLAVVFQKSGITLSDREAWKAKIGTSRKVLEEVLGAEELVYGVTTGVGFESSKVVTTDNVRRFGDSVVAQHGCGVGAPFPATIGRAVVLARLVGLAKGYSGVRFVLLEAMRDLLEHDVIPVIPRLGSVGASGDLTPLSYLAAVLAGDREAYYLGSILPAREALQRAGLDPFQFGAKEQLAVMNGTSVMTAVGIVAASKALRLLTLTERVGAVVVEVVRGRSGAFDETIHRVKGHPGQIESAASIRRCLEGTKAVADRLEHERLIQDPYSVRCVPQVVGAARDAVSWVLAVLERELNSANDNPIIDPEKKRVLLGGNFFGGHVAFAMDLLKIAVASVADLLDRQFAMLVDSRFNEGLPETLVNYQGCGLKGLQITCSAITALAVQRSSPDSVLSRSTEVGNQDKVSMGLNAALNLLENVGHLESVIATMMIAISNAAAQRDQSKFASLSRKFLGTIREVSPVLEEDRRLDHDIEGLVALMEDDRSGLFF